MIKHIFNTIITHKINENMTLRYFNNISRNIQGTTSAVAAAQTSDPGQRLQVLVQVVTPSQRQYIAFQNLY